MFRIKEFIFILLILLFNGVTSLHAQDYSKDWEQYFSYLDISAFSQSENRIYVAAENSVFVYDKQSNQIETISTIQGLSGGIISAITYVESQQTLYIGYENGLIQIYNEISKETFSVVDIIDKTSIPPNRKRINDLYLYNGLIYISADFGISIYNVVTSEFGDTYYIGNNGAQIKVNQTVITEGFIYAATEQNIKRADVDNPNLIDFQEWNSFAGGNWLNIISANSNIYASATNNRVYRVIGTSVSIVETFGESILDLEGYNSQVAVTTKSRCKIYDGDYSFLQQFLASDYNSVNFNTAIPSDDNNVFIGTYRVQSQGKEGNGVIKTSLSSPLDYVVIHPESPLLNKFTFIDTQGGQIWGTHGGYPANYNPFGGVVRAGISRFKNNLWENISYSNLNNQINNPWALSHLSINPFNSDKVYVSGSIYGLLELQNDQVINFYNGDNSSLNPFYLDFIFLYSSKFDDNGDFWIMNGRYEKPLNRYRNGAWQSFSFEDIIPNPFSNLGFAEFDFDANGNIFIGSFNYGIISFTENGNILRYVNSSEDNMPNRTVQTVKVDKNNQVWIGTREGLRVIYSPDEFVAGNKNVESIIVLDDGEASELLYQQSIMDIEIDGSNNKWIATIGNGVFYFSPDGQKTIYHFTTDNSPLPSDNVFDMSIDGQSGKVYFATENGMVSFKSGSSEPQENLEEAYVYPNPVRPDYNFEFDKIKITNLSDNVNIKITDIEGNLVNEAQTNANGRFKGFSLEIDGGTALWNGKNLSGNKVASGVYLILLNDLETFETKVLKVMIIR